MRKLEAFVRAGGILIATRRRPALVPGFNASAADQSELAAIVQRLFDGPAAKAYFVEDEKQLGGKVASLLQPDLSLSPNVPEIGFVHRHLADSELFFVANTSNAKQTVRATFRITGLQAELWDPLSGTVSAVKPENASQSATTLRLDLEPYGSKVIVFSGRAQPTLMMAAGASQLKPLIDLSKDWRVSFGDGVEPVEMEKLRSWTDDEATRYFSGTATYEKEFTLPTDFGAKSVRLDLGEAKPLPEQPLRSGMQTWLDGPVREAAIVYINERRAGSIWCPPYSLEVGSLLQPGPNKIRIVVANLALNYMAGRRLPDYRLLNLRYGERFQAQDMDKVQPVPSGLTGPIRLLASQP